MGDSIMMSLICCNQSGEKYLAKHKVTAICTTCDNSN